MSERTRSAGDESVGTDPRSGVAEAPHGLTPHRDDVEPALTELCVGTSLRVASMEFLEAAVTIVQQAMGGSDAHAEDGAVCLRPSHMAVVSTCNRVEFYLAVETDTIDEMIHAVRSEIFQKAGSSVDLDSEQLVYVLRGSDAVRHLCRVAAGLDSLAIGEHEIAGQVSRGFARTVNTEGWNVALIAMAEAARRASRRARKETGIGRGRISLSSVAIELAERELESLDGKNVLVVGAGKVGRLACASIEKAGGAVLTVANRGTERGGALAEDFGGYAAQLGELSSLLQDSDVVFATTGSLEPILTLDLVAQATRGRAPDRPLIIVDLAVPRDVEPAVGELEGVRLFGLSDLRVVSDANLEGRRRDVGLAEVIVEQEVAQYDQARAIRRVQPVLAAFWQRAEGLREIEIERLFGEFEGIDPETRSRIEHFSGALVRKLLHEPSLRLRSASADGHFHEYSKVVRQLFALDEEK
ncbi:MAG TPA: glutamyl-tRNA reductase [Gemmatimonadetes bacterium]|nr:glutamyl-tRNA reductase [Gemmatimonadota bacterium]HIN52533.1 glutamyl-tRNA reductase [Gemmatimonadota bacterium]